VKVLIVTNLYPPHHQGGYELRCSQVAEHLHRDGHDVRVVTSRYLIDGTRHAAAVREDVVNGVPVSRFLRHHRLDPWQPGGRLYNLDAVRGQVADIARLQRVFDEFRPDVVNWWNLEGVTKAILRLPHDRGVPSVYCIDDNWMIREFGALGDADLPFWFDFWRVKWGPTLARPLARLCLAPIERRLNRRGVATRGFTLPPGHLCFISDYRRFQYSSAGFDVQSSEVIHGGVSSDRFYVRRSADDYTQGPLRLLYAGYIDERRGLHTIVEALGLLAPQKRARFHLSVAHAGPAEPDEYRARISTRIQQLGLTRHVSFLGRIAHEEMPAVYTAHDVLVFTSTMNEGLPMVMMEAMCAGLAVPNTGSGGAIELAERAGAPLFPKDHPFALSRLLVALEANRARVEEIGRCGQQTVLREFTIDRMLERTSAALRRAALKQDARELKVAVG
jgi:glycosyltransferase involved in cell wall biosynthesis